MITKEEQDQAYLAGVKLAMSEVGIKTAGPRADAVMEALRSFGGGAKDLGSRALGGAKDLGSRALGGAKDLGNKGLGGAKDLGGKALDYAKINPTHAGMYGGAGVGGAAGAIGGDDLEDILAGIGGGAAVGAGAGGLARLVSNLKGAAGVGKGLQGFQSRMLANDPGIAGRGLPEALLKTM